MVAVERDDVVAREPGPRRHRERIVGGVAAAAHPRAQAQVRVDTVEHAPYPAQRIIGMRILSFADGAQPVDRRLPGLGPAHLLETGQQFVGKHLIFGAGPDVADAELVGGHEHRPIRHALGDPGRVVFVVGQGAHLEYPGFLLVAHQQGLAGREIAIPVDQGTHQADGLARRPAAFQRHPRQFRAVEQAAMLAGLFGFFLRYMRRLEARAVGALAHHEVVLVHDAVAAVEVGERMSHLRDAADQRRVRPARHLVARAALTAHQARIGIAAAVDHAAQAARRVMLGRDVDDALVRQLVVVRVGHHHRAVGRGAIRDDHRGAHDGLPYFLAYQTPIWEPIRVTLPPVLELPLGRTGRCGYGTPSAFTKISSLPGSFS